MDFPPRVRSGSYLGRIEQKLDDALSILIQSRITRKGESVAGNPDHNFHTSSTFFIVLIMLMLAIGFGIGGLIVALGIFGV